MAGNPTTTPSSGILVTIRLIKSFEYRTTKNMIIKDLDPTVITFGRLKEIIQERIANESAFKVYRNVPMDTFKLYFHSHGTKSQNLIINLEHEDKFLQDGTTLAEEGIDNETEISFFNLEAYLAFKNHPETKW
ncbi:hypothetical protein HDU97_007513 [Phlyctochytrium planicorne]|nr:hypothetical protein HDU97_007513 [Phlyctochytrium planicorne]